MLFLGVRLDEGGRVLWNAPRGAPPLSRDVRGRYMICPQCFKRVTVAIDVSRGTLEIGKN